MSAGNTKKGPLSFRYVFAAAQPFGRRRGRLLGISPNSLRSTRVHPTLNPKRFSLDLATASPANNFEETHLAEILEIIARTDILQYLRPWQVMILKSVIWDCKGADAEIKRFLLTWFDIFNSAFFGGSLKVLRDQLRLRDDADFGDLGAFGFGLSRGSVGFLFIKKTQKKLGSSPSE
jgi:hypothetical protein